MLKIDSIREATNDELAVRTAATVFKNVFMDSKIAEELDHDVSECFAAYMVCIAGWLNLDLLETSNVCADVSSKLFNDWAEV